MDDGTGPRRLNKIDRVIGKYELADLGDELERCWLREGRDGASTRELARDFNRRVLAVAVDRSDAFTLSDDVGQLYEQLTDETAGDGTLVRSRMEQSGIDVDEVTSDFVSHQTVYRYLTEHRGVNRSEVGDEERRRKAIETIQRLRGRTTAVTEQNVENLRSTEVLSIDEFSVLNDIQILCEKCGRNYDVVELIEQGGCVCERD